MQSSRGTLTKVRDVDICGQIQRVVHKKHAIEVMVLRYESYHMILCPYLVHVCHTDSSTYHEGHNVLTDH